MSADAAMLAERPGVRARLTYQLRVLRVIAGTEYKLKYAESALGYVWSVAKPLTMFAVLYTVFGRFFKLNAGFEHYPLYLLIGIVLWNFFLDGTTLAMTSLVSRGSLLRKLSFPYQVIPVSVTISKIRFLEGEGLIDPERTASGYRKFFEDDVERLRQILKLQRWLNSRCVIWKINIGTRC